MSLIQQFYWQTAAEFDDSTYEISSPSPQQVDTIAFYGNGYAHSLGGSSVLAKISLLDADTGLWSEIASIPIPASGGTDVNGADAYTFNNVSFTFPLTRVSKVRLHGSTVGNLFMGWGGNDDSIELSLSAPIERHLNEPQSLSGNATVSANLRVIVSKKFNQQVNLQNDTLVTVPKVTNIKKIRSLPEGQATVTTNNMKVIHIKKFTPFTLQGTATVNSKVVKIGQIKANMIFGTGLTSNKKPRKMVLLRSKLEVDSEMVAYRWDRDVRTAMFDYLPKYYDTSKIVNSIVTSEASELTRISVILYDILDQFFIDTATWGLERWEDICGMTSNSSLSYSERRNKIKQRLVGHGTLTKKYLKEQFEFYYKIDIQEVPREHQVIITITQMRAIPESLKFFTDLMELIKNLVPAHLEPIIKFLWAPWQEMKDADIRWEDISKYSNWNQLKTQYYDKPSHVMQENISWDYAEEESMTFNNTTMSWDNFDKLDPNSYPDLEEFDWTTIETKTWKDFDSKITNKWEVAI